LGDSGGLKALSGLHCNGTPPFDHLDDVVLRCAAVTLRLLEQCPSALTPLRTFDDSADSTAALAQEPGAPEGALDLQMSPLRAQLHERAVLVADGAVTVRQLLAEVAALAQSAGLAAQVLDGLRRVSPPGSAAVVYEVQLL